MKPYYEDEHAVIYHGDLREVLPSIANDSIDIIWTDPPYGHNNGDGDLLSRRAEAVGDGVASSVEPIANDGPDEMREVVDFMLIEAARVLKRDSCCCCCCCGGGGPSPTFAWLAHRMDSFGLRFFHSLIWDKKNPGMGWRFRRQHEMIMVSHRRGGRLKWVSDGSAIPNIISESPPRVRQHPNEKPIALINRVLVRVGVVGDVVLDPFMGSGSTLVAAKALGLKSVGIELEERYCEIAVNRLRQESLFGTGL